MYAQRTTLSVNVFWFICVCVYLLFWDFNVRAMQIGVSVCALFERKSVGRLQQLFFKIHYFISVALLCFALFLFGVDMNLIFVNRRFTRCTWYGFDSVAIFGWNNKSGSLSFLNLKFGFYHNFHETTRYEIERADQQHQTNEWTKSACFRFI